MTQIALISGIPGNEYADRSRNLAKRAYIPYTSMTKGEMHLALLREQANLYASVYPEAKEYSQAVQMIDGALRAGVSRGVNFVGAIADHLQEVARAIALATKQTAPVAGRFFGARTSLAEGVHIGADPIVPVVYRDYDCNLKATEWANAFYKQNKESGYYRNVAKITKPKEHQRWLALLGECQTKQFIEKIMNERLESSSHHVLYKGMPSSFAPALGTQALTKRLLQLAGVNELANLAGVGGDVMKGWTEIGIQRTNVISGMPPYNSFISSALLTPDPQRWASAAHELSKGKWQSIGTFVVVAGAITALVVAIGGALASAAALRKGAEQKQANAFSTTQGFGTDVFSSGKDDFLQSGQTSGGLSNNTLLIGGAAVAAYLLFND